MKNKKTLASVIGSPWFVSPQFIGDYLPMLSGFMQNKDLTTLFDTDTPVFSIQSFSNQNSTTNSEGKVGLINLSGIVFKDDQLCGPIGTTSMISMMKEWDDKKLVDSVLFYTSSPGGEASGTRRFAKFIKDYSLPTAAYIDGVAGSAAYYIISATDKIFMEPDADVVGSIGAMTSYKNIDKYLEKQGIELSDIYADSSYDKNLVSRKAKEGDFTLLKEGLNPLAEKFENDVKAFRPDLKDEACHGKVYAPEHALQVGLIDALGSFDDAINYLQANSTTTPTPNKTVKMNKSYKAIETVLGETFEVDENRTGLLLTEEQSGKVEDKLALLQSEKATAAQGNATIVDEVNTSLKLEGDAKVTDIAGAVAALNAKLDNTAIVDEVNTSLELEGDAKVTDVATAFTAMKVKLGSLGEQPGETHTNLGEHHQGEKKHTYVDFTSSIYNK